MITEIIPEMVIKNHRIHSGDVRFIEIQPGDGTRYTCFVSELPADVEGGVASQHVLITTYTPEVHAYVFAKGGFLMYRYLAEKFGFKFKPTLSQWIIYKLVGFALDRETENSEVL